MLLICTWKIVIQGQNLEPTITEEGRVEKRGRLVYLQRVEIALHRGC